MKNEGIFRQKSLERIQSPENLNEYVRVTGPGVWLLLIGMTVLLAGAIVWGIFGKLDTVLRVDTHVFEGKAVCYVDETYIGSIKEGMPVRLEEKTGRIGAIGAEEESEAGCMCEIVTDEVLPDGLYVGEILLESRSPISFVLN